MRFFCGSCDWYDDILICFFLLSDALATMQVMVNFEQRTTSRSNGVGSFLIALRINMFFNLFIHIQLLRFQVLLWLITTDIFVFIILSISLNAYYNPPVLPCSTASLLRTQ